jgi:hypothetical protein
MVVLLEQKRWVLLEHRIKNQLKSITYETMFKRKGDET